ncbi:MAG: hypothetical protein AAFN68_11545, partial [Pseudomonadota bacterium]
QMAYELYSLLNDHQGLQSFSAAGFDLMVLWPLLLDSGRSNGQSNSQSNGQVRADRRAWALGHALSEYWTQSLPISQVSSRVDFYLDP